MKVRVTNIQRFSLQDGPGIRTTVFLKGCMLRCSWCSNPENMSYEIQEYNHNGKTGIYGFDIDLENLYNEILKDKKYYSINNGGVTFSGGEALLQFDKLEPLLEKLKKSNINICIETSLYAPIENLKLALKYVDEFIIDIKILDKDICKDVLKSNIDLYYQNIEYLFENRKSQNIMFRIPITNEYTFLSSNINSLENLLSKYSIDKIEMFKVHRLGEKKYESLNMVLQDFKDVDDNQMDKIYNILKKYCDDVKINSL